MCSLKSLIICIFALSSHSLLFAAQEGKKSGPKNSAEFQKLQIEILELQSVAFITGLASRSPDWSEERVAGWNASRMVVGPDAAAYFDQSVRNIYLAALDNSRLERTIGNEAINESFRLLPSMYNQIQQVASEIVNSSPWYPWKHLITAIDNLLAVDIANLNSEPPKSRIYFLLKLWSIISHCNDKSLKHKFRALFTETLVVLGVIDSEDFMDLPDPEIWLIIEGEEEEEEEEELESTLLRSQTPLQILPRLQVLPPILPMLPIFHNTPPQGLRVTRCARNLAPIFDKVAKFE